MELSLLEIWETMGFLARLVAVSLVCMGVASLAVAIERSLVLAQGRAASRRFGGRVQELLMGNEIEAAIKLAKGREFRRSPLARLTLMGLSTFLDAQSRYGANAAIEMCRRSLERGTEELGAEARRGMGLLASVGSTSPFIGLFGTVIGIITAFQGIAASGGGGIEAVSAGIAEALIVTAVGLIVAIFAVLVFNYLSAKMDRVDMQMQHAMGSMVDNLEAAHGNAA
jgi:biopolymer transport protein ExbB/TolQ